MRPIDYLAVLQRHKWYVIVPAVVVALVALIGSFFQTPIYSASIDVLLTADSGAVSFGPVSSEAYGEREPRLQTQVSLVKQRLLLNRVIKKLGLKMTSEQLGDATTVAMSGQTNLMMIEIVHKDPKLARQIADALAEEYVSWSAELERQRVRSAREEVARSLASAERQVEALGTSGTGEGDRAKLDAARAWYAQLAEKYEQLRFTEQAGVSSGSIVASATLSPNLVAPKPSRNAVLGLVAGLVIGLILASRAEYLDDSLRSSEEAEELFGVSVIGRIPAERQVKGTGRFLEALHYPHSAVAAAYRVLGERLALDSVRHGAKVILVASALSGEGRSTVAANLAVVLSQAGDKVVLVACDFRHPSVRDLLNANSALGLSDVLAGDCEAASALVKVAGIDNLLALTEGTRLDRPSELLNSSALEGLMTILSEWADWIIVDTPPLLQAPDATTVARWAEGVLMVVKSGVSTRAASDEGRVLLQKAGKRILGVVTLGFRIRSLPPVITTEAARSEDLARTSAPTPE